MNRSHDPFRVRIVRAVRRRKHAAGDLGQAGIVAVVAFSVLASLIGAVIVQTIVTSDPLFQGKAVEIYAHRAVEAGQNAYLTTVNANPSLAQCSTNTNNSGTCGGHGLRAVERGQRRRTPRVPTSSTTPSAIPSRSSTPPPTP